MPSVRYTGLMGLILEVNKKLPKLPRFRNKYYLKSYYLLGDDVIANITVITLTVLSLKLTKLSSDVYGYT